MKKPHVRVGNASDEKWAALPVEAKDAFVFAVLCALRELGPRHFVDLMTRSSFEIGRIFKRGLRDALYERRKQERKEGLTFLKTK